jgi:hypothetical protein
MKRLREALLALVVVVACSPLTEEETSALFKQYVATANGCREASECTVIFTECPLGCFTAVRRDRKADVEGKAQELVARYRGSGGGCIYSCAQPGALTCEEGTCRVAALPPGS